MKNNITNYLLMVLQHKNFYYFVSISLSLTIIYYGYNYYIQQSYENVQSIKSNIGKFKEKRLKKDIKKLEKEKLELSKKYQALLEDKRKLEELLYKNKYDVVVDVMDKLNQSSFNIYKYELSDDYEKITLELNGSYLNLIKLFDYLQTIKADVSIQRYKVELVDDKMLIEISLKVGILKL